MGTYWVAMWSVKPEAAREHDTEALPALLQRIESKRHIPACSRFARGTSTGEATRRGRGGSGWKRRRPACERLDDRPADAPPRPVGVARLGSTCSGCTAASQTALGRVTPAMPLPQGQR